MRAHAQPAAVLGTGFIISGAILHFVGVLVAPELVAFVIGSLVSAYFIDQSIDQIAASDTDRELLAAELSVGFMVAGWTLGAVGLGRSALRFRQVAPKLRGEYNSRVSTIPEQVRSWKSQGLSLREIAQRVFAIRHEARLSTRALTEQELNVRNLQVRDYLRYGHSDGPTFADMIQVANSQGFYGAAAYEYIIGAGARTNAAINEVAAAR